MLRSELIPRALVVTPNLPEAAALTGASLARNEAEMEVQAREILSLGARNVLIKGGHGEGDESVDLLIGQGEVVRLSAKRIATKNTHGTGCTLSSAIAAGLAKGRDVVDGVRRTPRPTSPRPSPPPINSRSATATDRCIIFTRNGETHDARDAISPLPQAPPPACWRRRRWRRAQAVKWRMVTSWPKRLPGPGMSAERVAERIRALSGGRIDITVYAAGEVVPAFEVLDAVGNGVADIGHTASFYWQGKMPAAAFFTTVPFGLTPSEHVAWIEAGGGQALWDELYAPFGVKPFMGGNTGVCMGGWFRRELKSLADLCAASSCARSASAAKSIAGSGATPQTTPPAEILTSLQSGVIDGAEFVGPGTDIALGLYRVAPFYYYPGFNKPNGTGECIVALKAWNALVRRTARPSSRMPARRRRITRWPRWSGSTRRRWSRS